MTTSEQLRLAPIPASIDNVEEWEGIARQIAAEAGVPTALTPEVIAAMIGSAVVLLFEADDTKDMSLLRGTFADPVIAQRQTNAGCLQAPSPRRRSSISLVCTWRTIIRSCGCGS
jgi:predicted LPLAT superfamily acyltransferase